MSKVNISNEITSRSNLGAMILNAISADPDQSNYKKFLEYYQNKTKTNSVFEIKITIDDFTFDIKPFFDKLIEQYDYFVSKEAKKMVEDTTFDRFDNVRELLDDLSERLQEEINLKMEDCEKS